MALYQLNVHPDMDRLLMVLAGELRLPIPEVIREAASWYGWTANEFGSRNKLLVQRGPRAKDITEIVIPSLQPMRAPLPPDVLGRGWTPVVIEGTPDRSGAG